MSEQNFRIPRMTVAVMVFGGLGCGGDDSGGSANPAGDASRIRKLGEAECKLEFTCPGADVSGKDYSTQQECVDEFVSETSKAVAKVSADCADAALEYYECYVGLGCAGDDTKCARSYATYEAKCKGMFDDTVDTKGGNSTGP